MSWIAVSDLTSPLFNIRGIGVSPDDPNARPPMQADEILPTGTMMLELRYTIEPGMTQELFAYRRRKAWLRELHVTFDSEGNLSVALRQGGNRSQARIKLPIPERDSRMRISYAWNAPVRSGLLTVELLDIGRMFQAPVDAPVPLPAEDVRVMIRNGRRTKIAPAVQTLAFADTVEPVGFGSGIADGTFVETTTGPVPVNRLRLGDEVITATSGPQPVRWIGKRTVPALGGFCPVRLRAPFFGLGSDVLMAPDNRVRIDLAEAEYMFGTDDVLVPAAHLVNGKHARREGGQRLVTYYHVLLDVHDCLLHDGLWAESLFVGTIARRPDVARTTVIGEMPPSAIPQHRNFARQRLSDFEARSLAAALQQA